MADYLSLEDAAKKLGIATEKLVDLRSQGQVRGFRDGASWKFPETEIERLADELADMGAGSGMLVSESDIGSDSKGSGNIIGGDALAVEGGSDLGIGGEAVKPGSSGGSDVNLVPGLGDDSDVSLVASDSGIGSGIGETGANADDDDLLVEDDDLPDLDSKELRLDDPVLMHDSDSEIDLGGTAKDGSKSSAVPESSGSLDIGAEPEDELALSPDSDLSFTGSVPDDDSGDMLLGAEDDSGMDAMSSDVMGSDIMGSGLLDEGSQVGSKLSTEASSLELMSELDTPVPGSGSSSALHSSGADVLSELDLLGADSGSGSGLISGDSENLLVSSGLGSSLGSSLGDDVLGGDDALADDDDLVIADDDDDLVIDSSGTDISVAGDSGINLMSPSDSGLSLESEPLDLAGSSISALDLGAELSEGSDVSDGGSGSGSGSDGSGSMVDFQADEEFQLSPSGVGLEADFESGSQVIEVEDSEAIGEAVEFAETDAPVGDAFATDEGGFADDAGVVETDAAGAAPVGLETTTARRPTSVAATGGMGTYEVPFNLLQCLALLSIIMVMSLGGMLMTDLIRNMWTYTEPSAPVSSLTNALIDLMGWS